MTSIRPTAVAGSFYPASAVALNSLLDDCFNVSPLGPRGVANPSSDLIAGMAPHAGPEYSGPCAAHFYSRLEPSVKRVLLLGVNHWGHGDRACLSPWDSWRTPLGDLLVDQEVNACLEARLGYLTRDPRAHIEEHSIEIQLPFVQRALGNPKIVPISLSRISPEECAEIGQAIAETLQLETVNALRTVTIASSDLSHYLSPQKTDQLDQLAVDQVLALNPVELLRIVEEKNITMCGVIPTAIMLFAAKFLGVKRATLLKHCHSGDVTPMRQVVGYASIVLERQSAHAAPA